jgi:hypothetical protein
VKNERKDAHPLVFDGCDKAVIGYISRCGQVPMVVYDWSKLVRVFEKQGMSNDEAIEWVSFNCEGGWLGPGTPGILHRGNADFVQEELA